MNAKLLSCYWLTLLLQVATMPHSLMTSSKMRSAKLSKGSSTLASA